MDWQRLCNRVAIDSLLLFELVIGVLYAADADSTHAEKVACAAIACIAVVCILRRSVDDALHAQGTCQRPAESQQHQTLPIVETRPAHAHADAVGDPTRRWH